MSESFFRFRSISKNSISAFMKDDLFASTPDQFNDPYDSIFNYDQDELYQAIINDNECLNLFALDILYEFQKEHPETTKEDIIEFVKNNKSFVIPEIDNLVMHALHILRRQMIIACFCSKATKEIMWSHYTEYGRGFALEYDKKELEDLAGAYLEKYVSSNIYDFDNLQNLAVYGLKEVNYDANRLDGTFIALQKIKSQLKTNEEYRKGKLTPRKYDLDEEKFNSFVLYKSKDWEYEDEWRLIVPNHDLSKTHGNIGKIRPKAVYLGEFISFSDEYTICSIAKNKKIPIYKMKSSLDKKRFGLKKYKLTDSQIEQILTKFSDDSFDI